MYSFSVDSHLSVTRDVAEIAQVYATPVKTNSQTKIQYYCEFS